MKKFYLLTALLNLLLFSRQVSAQCSVTITTNPATTQLTCKVTSITLRAEAKALSQPTYLWSNGETSSSITVNDAGLYWVKIEAGINGACQIADTIRITKDAIPKITAVAFPDTICSGSTTTLIGFGADGLVWNPGGLTGNIVKVSPATTTTFTVSGTTADGCTVDTTIKVVVNQLPMASISGTTNVCQNSASPPVTFTGSGGTRPYTFAFNINGGTTQLINSTDASDIATISAPTDRLDTLRYNLLSVTDKNGCVQTTTDKRSATVIVLPGPALTSTKDTSLCNSLPFAYNAKSTVDGTTFSWQRILPDSVTGTGRSNGASADIFDFFENNTNHQVVVKYVFNLSTNGLCKASDTVKVTVDPTPVIKTISDVTYCNGTSVTGIAFSSTSRDSSFSWSNDNINIGLPASGSGSIPNFVATNKSNDAIKATVIVDVQASAKGCVGRSETFTITVLPGPALTSPKLVNICSDSLFSYKATSTANGTSFKWNRQASDSVTTGDAGTGENENIINRLHNKYQVPATISYLFTLSTGGACKDTERVTVIVNPTPKIDGVKDLTFCNGETVNGIPFSSSSPNASFTWTNDNPDIGLPKSGIGNIPTFTAANKLTVAATAKIVVRVTSGLNDCPGNDSVVFRITVRPGPALKEPRALSICSGDSLAYTATSTEPGTSFEWIRKFDSAITSTGPISALGQNINERLSNKTALPKDVLYDFTLKPSQNNNSCAVKQTLTVRVNPTPQIDSIPNYTFCNGDFVKAGILFSSKSPDSSFTWEMDKVDIGLPDSGSGSILPFNATNKTGAPIFATINVNIKASSNGCAGPGRSFKITVLPGPTLLSVKDTTICNNVLFNYPIKSSAAQTSISWNRLRIDSIGSSTGLDTVTSGTITDKLQNTGLRPKLVKYAIRLMPIDSAITCVSNDTVVVRVNPTPTVDAVSPKTFCNDSLVQAIEFSSGTNASLTWISDTSIGFGTKGAGNIPAFITSNPGDSALRANLKVAPSIGVCKGDTGRFIITIYPTPSLTTSKVASVCSDSLFTYTAKSSAAGTRFAWTRLANPVLTSTSTGSGSDSIIRETLRNNTRKPDTATYVFTLYPTPSGNGCAVTEILKVVVNLTPVIDTLRDTTFCNGNFVNGVPFRSTSPDSSFTWSNNNIGIGLPATGSGSIPRFVATNKTDSTIYATITVNIKASADGCPGPSRTFRITVNPSPVRPSFTSLFKTPDSLQLKLCSESENINFDVTTRKGGVKYAWRAVPVSPATASGLNIRDTAHANTVISFYNQGTYRVQSLATADSTACADTVTQVVMVSKDQGFARKEKILLMQPGSLLLYPDNSLKKYQWGYSDTLPGRAFGPPQPLRGQVYQYFVPDTSHPKVDTSKYLYWVQLENDSGCQTVVYYNGPYKNRRVQTQPPVSSEVQLQIIPNPNNGLFLVALKGNIYGRMEATIYNAAGHLLLRKSFVKTVPEITEAFRTTNFSAGLYILELRGSDLKKITTRFVIQH